jgi:cytochrome b
MAFMSKSTVPVWSIGVRLLHWTLALSMIGSFATHESGGFWGSGYWRFSQFLQGISATLAYAKDVIKHRELRYLGHNPLGGWMVVALLADAVATGFTGWLFTTDRFWGVEWLEELHGALGEALLPLLFLHIAGAVFTSYRHRENLVGSMLHGRKPAAEPNDVV